jgi:4-amino-4-deoxy-L-arabinose transferase-like glycosyltransferase
VRANGRLSGRWPLAALAAHCLGFALFWPRAFLVVDEERYVSQALAFSRGSTTIPGAEIIYPASTATMLSDYPPGTSFIQTPFVWAFGWRGAALASMLGLVGGSRRPGNPRRSRC